MEPAELSTMLKPFLRRSQESQWKENHTASSKMGNGESGNGERGTGNGERGTGNGERGTGNL